MENMRGTPWAVIDSECRDHAVVQHLDPFDGLMDAITLTDSEQGEAVIFLVSERRVFVGLLPELGQLLMKVSNGGCVLILLLMVESVPVSDDLNEGLGNSSESDWVIEVKTVDYISCSVRRDGVSARNQHKHGDVIVRGAEWERVQ